MDTNTDILSCTGLFLLADHIAWQHTATFGHIAQLADDVPAHQALKCLVDTSIAGPPPRPALDMLAGTSKEQMTGSTPPEL